MARTSEATREDVKKLWAELNIDGGNPSGVDVYNALKRKAGGREVRKLRTVQGDIKSFKEVAQASQPAFTPKIWDKWDDGEVSPEALPLVLLVNSVSNELIARPIWQHEAKWAERIYRALDSLDPVTAWFLVWSYALREVVQRILQDDSPFTIHLDLLTAHQPWKPENRSNWNLLSQSQSPSLVSAFLWLEDLGNLNLPEGVNRELALWATRQLIGPWDEVNDDDWSWQRVLESRYGVITDDAENE